MDLIVQRWPASFRQRYGGDWPSCYATWDLETTGFYRQNDVVVEMAHCLVEHGKVVNRLTLVLNWLDHPIIRRQDLEYWLERTRERMAAAGKNHQMTCERMATEGMAPEEAFRFYLDLFQTLRAKNIPVVAHNGYGFDESMFQNGLQRLNLSRDFSFGDDGLIDTAAIEKATQAMDNLRMRPYPSDTMRSYCRRVLFMRLSGVRYALDRDVIPRYRLDEKHQLDLADLHGAGADAYVLHLLMEEYRSLLNANPTLAAPARRVPVPVGEVPWEVPPPSAPRRRRGQRNC